MYGHHTSLHVSQNASKAISFDPPTAERNVGWALCETRRHSSKMLRIFCDRNSREPITQLTLIYTSNLCFSPPSPSAPSVAILLEYCRICVGYSGFSVNDAEPRPKKYTNTHAQTLFLVRSRDCFCFQFQRSKITSDSRLLRIYSHCPSR